MNLITSITLSVLIIIIPIVISLLLPRKLKFIRYSLWAISIFVLLPLGVIIPYSIYDDNKESKYLIGTYKFDLKKSKFGNTDLSKFNLLILNVKDNYTFALNDTTPFFVQKEGSWLYHIDGDAEFIRCKFQGAKFAYQISQRDSDLIFESNILKNGSEGDRIAFKHNK